MHSRLSFPRRPWPGAVAATLIAFLIFAGYAPPARAGDMDALGGVIIAFFAYCGLVIVVGAIAFYQCRRIDNRRLRALVRFVILVVLFTPVPLQQANGDTKFLAAFLLLPSRLINGGMYSRPVEGILSHPVLLAYGIVLMLGIPLLMAWVGLGERQERRRADP